jgi:alkyl sulfatase BDS1-like metallo-beta-lactamase superfamily hydrolase
MITPFGQRAMLVVAITGLAACGGPEPAPAPLDVGSNAGLAAHTAEFERRIYDVTDGVHVAVGYGLANSILIEGTDGVIIVDTLESVEAAERVKADFDKITTKPVKAIIYTHNHADHIFGARAFVSGDVPPIYAHDTTTYYIDRVVSVLRPAIYRRSMRMFGNYLPEGGVLNAGIGPALHAGHGGGTPGLIRPTRTFADEHEMEVAGVKIRLVHAPGETNDQLFVWLPDERVLMPGDNFYKSFPNLYTIRGTPYRDVLGWVASLDTMRAYTPAHLVPSHTRPISGEERIRVALTDYRDAIQFVHDQTVRGINKGLGPDELVTFVRLPPHLAKSPYLQEYYGTVEWSVRSIFTGYLGWYGGDATNLSPLNPDERARRLAELAGGNGALEAAARNALAAGDYQWAAELADGLVRVAGDSSAGRALQLKAEALTRLGERHRSANGRHYYLTQALELTDVVEITGQDLDQVPLEQIASAPLGGIMNAMAVHLVAEKSLETDRIVGFRFPDVGEAYTIHVRRGIADVQPVFPADPEIAVTVDSTVWKEILVGRRNPVVAFASGEVEIEGSTLDLVNFLRLFERS